MATIEERTTKDGKKMYRVKNGIGHPSRSALSAKRAKAPQA
jgi:hypothetical protein